MSDEARHVAFGVLSLKEYYAELSRRRDPRAPGVLLRGRRAHARPDALPGRSGSELGVPPKEASRSRRSPPSRRVPQDAVLQDRAQLQEARPARPERRLAAQSVRRDRRASSSRTGRTPAPSTSACSSTPARSSCRIRHRPAPCRARGMDHQGRPREAACSLRRWPTPPTCVSSCCTRCASRGWPTSRRSRGRAASRRDAVEAELADLLAAGMVRYFDKRGSWSLTPTGRAEHARLLRVDLDDAGCVVVVESAYRRILGVNVELLGDHHLVAAGRAGGRAAAGRAPRGARRHRGAGGRARAHAVATVPVCPRLSNGSRQASRTGSPSR